ncbi:MAG TPA: hypothetical protein DCS85_10085 [Verrucomicrobiales bacterium]|nr:hypothetical protein [Verrucomicrobiales bacterium]
MWRKNDALPEMVGRGHRNRSAIFLFQRSLDRGRRAREVGLMICAGGQDLIMVPVSGRGPAPLGEI